MSQNSQRSEPVLVNTTQALKDYCESFSREEFVAIDTEFMRDGTYWAKLCLVQIAGEKETILIDTCAKGLDLAPLGELLANEKLCKVFHAAGQDVEIFYKEFGAVPKNLFDTQIAARVLGYGEQIGYSALVADVTETVLPKDERFTDWSKRPLSKAQLLYAANDVIYLRIVYQDILEKLKARNRLAWIEKDVLETYVPENLIQDPWKMWRKIKVRTFDRRVLGRLQHLAAWREEQARLADVARTRILRDDVLTQIAYSAPKSARDLENIRGVRPGWGQGKHGEQVVGVVKTVESLPQDELPKLEKKAVASLSDAQEGQAALLKVLLAVRASAEDIVPRLIASNDDLSKLVRGDRDLPFLKGWKHDIFGRDALEILEEKAFLGLKDGSVICSRAPISARESDR